MCTSINPPGRPEDRSGQTAQVAEDARQANIARISSLVNEQFGIGDTKEARDAALSRQGLIDQTRDSNFSILSDELGRQFDNAGRNSRFTLARRGLDGGSAGVDTSAELTRRNDKGLLDIGNRADTLAESFRLADEQARQGVVGLVRSGLSLNEAQRQSLSSLQSNAAFATQQAQAQNLDDVFRTMAIFNQTRRQGQGFNDANALFRNQFQSGAGNFFGNVTG